MQAPGEAPSMSQSGNSATASSGRILAVDDQAANLRVVGILLGRNGYEVVPAASGPEALAAAQAQTPDLILLDMMMPGMDGFELLAALRALPALRDVPVVFLTAAHDRDLLLRAFDAGAVDYVTKPFMPEELLARVSAHVGLKQARDRLERVARERQELVNLVAHDLKNPLGSVLFASDMLRQPDCRAERVPRYLEVIRESAQDAVDYIRRYLESQARALDSATRNAPPQSAGLRETADWLLQRYELQFEARGMRLAVLAPERCGRVAIEPLVLRQVAENLVSNAMKYAQAGGELELVVRASSPGYWQLLAQDRGPGIPAARQRELFQPFRRLGEHDPADGLSSGLGLSLARQIVADAGGQLWYEDRGGGGARFLIELPAAD